MTRPRARPALVLAAFLAGVALQPQPVPAQSDVKFRSAADTTTPGTNRLFFAPTGRTLPAGVAEVGGYYLVAPYIGHAFHDRLMMAVGTPLLPDAFGRYWYAAPKAGLEISPWLSVAAGALVIVDVGGEPLYGSNVAETFFWWVATFGSRRGGLTVGLASDVGQLDVLPDGGLLMVGGEYELPVRSGDRYDTALRLIAESYMGLPGDEASLTDGSLHLIGLRLRAGRTAIEIVEGLRFVNGGLEIWTRIPLMHVSFLF